MVTNKEFMQLQEILYDFSSKIDERFSRIDDRLDRIDERLDHIDHRLDHMDERFLRIDEKFENLENQISNVKQEMNKGFTRVDTALVDNSMRLTQLVTILDGKKVITSHEASIVLSTRAKKM